jgi:glycosyltransferase involved in cell wall biosynthesis
MAKISIIIPTFNSGKTLHLALDSILEQSFSDYEVVIMDGVSTDNTTEIAAGYNDKRIKIFSEKDTGIYDAMNKGIVRVTGEWIYFLGSDDKLHSREVLQLISDKASENEYDVIYGDVYSPRFNGRYDGEFDFRKIFKKNVCHQAIFFKKNIFKKTGLFDTRYTSQADWHHNMQWILDPRLKKLYIDCVIADYADGGFSSTTRDAVFSREKIFTYLTNIKRQIPFAERIQLLKNEMKMALARKDRAFFLKLCINAPKILTGA